MQIFAGDASQQLDQFVHLAAHRLDNYAALLFAHFNNLIQTDMRSSHDGRRYAHCCAVTPLFYNDFHKVNPVQFVLQPARYKFEHQISDFTRRRPPASHSNSFNTFLYTWQSSSEKQQKIISLSEEPCLR